MGLLHGCDCPDHNDCNCNDHTLNQEGGIGPQNEVFITPEGETLPIEEKPVKDIPVEEAGAVPTEPMKAIPIIGALLYTGFLMGVFQWSWENRFKKRQKAYG